MKTNAICLLLKLVLSSVVLFSSALNAAQASEISQSSSGEPTPTQDRTSWQAIDWLMYMQTASVEQNYQGRFVFSRGPMSSAMSIIHQYSSGVEKERLKQLDGEMGEIVRDGERVMCVFPDNRVVEVESSPISHNFTNKFVGFMPGKSQYALSVVGKDRMIERSCVVVSVAANDDDRYSYKLWIDEQQGLLLKSELLDKSGKVLERFQYTQVSYPEEIDLNVFKVGSAGQAVKHEKISTEDKGLAWSHEMMWGVSWMPQGYMKINGQQRQGEHVMVYSDGLATFSVFVESVGKGAMPEGASQVGATIAYSLERHIQGHDYHVTVVGEIPAMTAMKIAKSVEPSM